MMSDDEAPEVTSRDGEAANGGRGRTILKAALWTVMVAAAVVVLFTWVFPWVESMQQDPTIGALSRAAGPQVVRQLLEGVTQLVR